MIKCKLKCDVLQKGFKCTFTPINVHAIFQVAPLEVSVKLNFPVPTKRCESKPITIPRVSCEVKSEKRCIQVLLLPSHICRHFLRMCTCQSNGNYFYNLLNGISHEIMQFQGEGLHQIEF